MDATAGANNMEARILTIAQLIPAVWLLYQSWSPFSSNRVQPGNRRLLVAGMLFFLWRLSDISLSLFAHHTTHLFVLKQSLPSILFVTGSVSLYSVVYRFPLMEHPQMARRTPYKFTLYTIGFVLGLLLVITELALKLNWFEEFHFRIAIHQTITVCFLLIAFTIALIQQLQHILYSWKDLHRLKPVTISSLLGLFLVSSIPLLFLRVMDLLSGDLLHLFITVFLAITFHILSRLLTHRRVVLRLWIAHYASMTILLPIIPFWIEINRQVVSMDLRLLFVAVSLIVMFFLYRFIFSHVTDLPLFKNIHTRLLAEKETIRPEEYPGFNLEQIIKWMESRLSTTFFTLYRPEREIGKDSYLVLEGETLRAPTTHRPPPAIFPPDVLPFLQELTQKFESKPIPLAPLFLVSDLIDIAFEKKKDLLIRSLHSLHRYGAEILVLVHGGDHISDAARWNADSTVHELPSVMVVGATTRRWPLDHLDMDRVESIYPLISLTLQNETLARLNERIRIRKNEANRRLSQDLSEESTPVSRGLLSSAFVYRPDGKMAEIMEQVERFAGRDSSILISGETGTGKEHIARIIHNLSGITGNFVAFNSSAVPQDLIENELFGHVKGAYTGAEEESEGFVGRARDGILFLDEIGEMPMESQGKLLRLVQEGDYEKLGSSEVMHTNARFIFATNRNLDIEVKRGKFRSDLYYRISTFEVRIPPLRERKEDIPYLVEHFLWIARETFHRPGLRITPPAMDLLINHKWPGNARELENVILRSVVVNETDVIDVHTLPTDLREQNDFLKKKIQLEKLLHEQERLERELTLSALEQCNGNQRLAASMLNISRGALQYRLKQYGLTSRSTGE